MTNALIDKESYEATAMAVLKAYLQDPTEATLGAATAALQEHFKQYSRWVAPTFRKLTITPPEGK